MDTQKQRLDEACFDLIESEMIEIVRRYLGDEAAERLTELPWPDKKRIGQELSDCLTISGLIPQWKNWWG